MSFPTIRGPKLTLVLRRTTNRQHEGTGKKVNIMKYLQGQTSLMYATGRLHYCMQHAHHTQIEWDNYYYVDMIFVLAKCQSRPARHRGGEK